MAKRLASRPIKPTEPLSQLQIDTLRHDSDRLFDTLIAESALMFGVQETGVRATRTRGRSHAARQVVMVLFYELLLPHQRHMWYVAWKFKLEEKSVVGARRSVRRLLKMPTVVQDDFRQRVVTLCERFRVEPKRLTKM